MFNVSFGNSATFMPGGVSDWECVCLGGGVWTERHLLKHYLSATTVSDGNNDMKASQRSFYVGVCFADADG